MNPVTHLFLSWLVADSDRLDKRDRAIVTLAGAVPDLDGIGILPEMLTDNSVHPLLWYSKYHHVLAHNLCFAILLSTIAFKAGRQKWKAAFFVFLVVHLHLLCDLVGSRGPDGYQWPILYFYPFSIRSFTWSGQWQLNAWPNVLITVIALIAIFYLAWKRGYSILEILSVSADRSLVKALRSRFGNPS